MTWHQDDKCDNDEIVFVFIDCVTLSSFRSLLLSSSQGLICAGTVRYGVPSLVEAVRRTSSSWCHNGGTLFICSVQNITKCQIAPCAAQARNASILVFGRGCALNPACGGAALSAAAILGSIDSTCSSFAYKLISGWAAVGFLADRTTNGRAYGIVVCRL